MPELEHITIKGFKSIVSIDELSLGPINVVIGSNGSGKSNFIGVFAFLHAIREGHLQEYVARAGGADKLLHFGEKTTPAMDLRIAFHKEENQYALTLVPNGSDQLIVSREEVDFWDKAKHARPYTQSLFPSGLEAGISESANYGIAFYVRAHLARWRVYHFHDTSGSSAMKKTADVNDNKYLRPDGANLAAFLYWLREQQTASYQLIRRTVQRVAPFFDDFSLEPQKLNPKNILLEWRHKSSEQYFDASSFSDGTLRFVALATLFLQPAEYRPSVILVDEPELGLHPLAIELLAAMIRTASTETQIIVSTQSSLLLDHFEPEEVLVADRVGGGTDLVRLPKEKLNRWLDDYSLGQLWEKNELGGRPVQG